eukprot:scaffold204265_cov27-Tisochrysis_lutea.AAC.6
MSSSVLPTSVLCPCLPHAPTNSMISALQHQENQRCYGTWPVRPQRVPLHVSLRSDGGKLPRRLGALAGCRLLPFRPAPISCLSTIHSNKSGPARVISFTKSGLLQGCAHDSWSEPGVDKKIS